MNHRDNYANNGYSFINEKFTKEELSMLLDYSNMAANDYIDIIRYQDIDEDLFIKHINKFKNYCTMYSRYHKLTTDTLMYFHDIRTLNNTIVKNQYITEDLMDYVIEDDIHNYDGFINAIAESQQLSDERMMMYFDILDPEIFGKYQQVSESVADALIGVMDDERLHKFFSTAGVYQKWSDEYLIDHMSYIDWFKFYIYPERVRIPYNKMDYFIPEDPNGYHPDDIEWPILSDDVDPRVLIVNNKHVTAQEWKKIISTQYDVYYAEEDHFVGYMAVTMEGYPLENHKFKFETGNTYETHADITNAIGSFGFNLRSFDEVIHLCHDNVVGDRVNGEKIILAKVFYEDVVCCYKTPTGYTIRTWKMEILRDYRENI